VVGSLLGAHRWQWLRAAGPLTEDTRSAGRNPEPPVESGARYNLS
jgi:hypothetical protein